ncbi:hypothetical protein [Xanthomonas axonopodis]
MSYIDLSELQSTDNSFLMDRELACVIQEQLPKDIEISIAYRKFVEKTFHCMSLVNESGFPHGDEFTMIFEFEAVTLKINVHVTDAGVLLELLEVIYAD